MKKIISEINELLLWCRGNTDKIWIILKYKSEPDVDVIRRIIDKTGTSELEYDEDGYSLGWVFAYLKEIVKMIHQAQQKKQFIICISFM